MAINAKKTAKEDIIDTDQVLRMFSEDKTKARKLYRAFMGDAISVKKDDIYSTVDGRVLGGEEFVGKVMQRIEDRISDFTAGYGCDAVIITAASSSFDPINFAGAISKKKGTIIVSGAVPTGFDREPPLLQTLCLQPLTLTLWLDLTGGFQL